MIVIVDERELVQEGYNSLFDREGVATAAFGSSEFGEWVTSAADEDLKSVRAFLIGDCGKIARLAAQDPRPHRRAGHRAQRAAFARKHAQAVRVRRRRRHPQAGPHPRDPGAHHGDPPPRPGRSGSSPRSAPCASSWTAAIPKSTAQPLPLPRRERRILEYLASNRGRRVTKTQVFNAIYGIFDDEVEENVVESHISKLRKKLREKLGFDPIEFEALSRLPADRLMPSAMRRRSAFPHGLCAPASRKSKGS